LHFASAGKHALVAVTAGVAANGIGTSAQVAASDKAASEKAKEDEKAKKEQEKRTGKSGGGSGGSDSTRPIYVVVGDSWSAMTARQRRQEADERIAMALRERDA
jgi:DNA gyrase/topoisomerase IV subunit B